MSRILMWSWLLALAVGELGVLRAWNGAWAAERRLFTEQEVKAAYLFNFGIFVEWPAHKLPAKDTPFVFGVLGNNAVATELERLARGNTLTGRKVLVRRLTPDADYSDCHVLFIGRDHNFAPILADLKTAGPKADGILTVAEDDKFAHRGGMISTILVEGSVRYNVNPAAAERAGLKISSKLLRSAVETIPSQRERGNQ